MTAQRRYYVAGWVAALGALATIITVVLTAIAMLFPDNALLEAVDQGWSVVTAALGVYVLVVFRRLLHAHAFRATDFLLSLLISGMVIGTVLQVAGDLVLESMLAAALLLVFAVAYGAVTAVFGYRLLPAAAVIAGPVKPLAILTIVCGAGIATLILLPIGILASVAADVCFALVFFRACEAPASDTTDQWSPQA